jgi:hypothetical protein
MKAFALRVIEALPLAVFLIYMAAVDPHTQIEWRTPYYAATALAVAGAVLLWRAGAIFNRIYLGIALYFVSGTLALLTRWPWLNGEYGRLEGTAMLYWVLATGLCFTLFDKRGYIGIDAAPRVVRTWSWMLVAVTVVATVVSICFIGNRLLSSFLPFIAVFTTLGVMKAHLHRAVARG